MSKDNETETANNLVVAYTVSETDGCVATPDAGGDPIQGVGKKIPILVEESQGSYDNIEFRVSSKCGDNVAPFPDINLPQLVCRSEGTSSKQWIVLKFPIDRTGYRLSWDLSLPPKPDCELEITIKLD